MPAVPLPKGAIRIRLLHSTAGKPWGTHFWVEADSSVNPTQAQLDTLAADIEADYLDQVVPAYSDSTTYIETQAEWFDGAGGTIVGSSSSPDNGGDSGSELPLSNCVVITWHITAAYRGGKPRNYLSGMTESMTGGSTNSITNTIASAFQTGWTHILTTVNAMSLASQPVTMGTYSFFEDAAERGGTPPPVARSVALFRAYNSCVVKTQIGTQRLRLRP